MDYSYIFNYNYYNLLASSYSNLAAPTYLFTMMTSSQLPYENEQGLFASDTSAANKFVPVFLRKPNYQRNPYYNYEFFDGKRKAPEGINQKAVLDTTDFNIKASESFEDIDIGYGYSVELDDYLKYREKEIRTQIWDSLVTKYDVKKALSRGDLAKMVAQSTGLTIPVPPNPVINIFGKPEISLNVNGEVNLRLGWRWDFQNLGTVSRFGQTQSSPIFSQDIRVNVNGRIGDKLKLGTDWNTRQTFDFDNKFKIGYEGEDDDIIKKVELGNVSLPIPSSLIGGGQTLFGVRADFQFGPLFLKTLFSQRRGERRFVDVRGGASKQYFSLRAYDYAKNHFFLDTAYLKIYDDYFENSTPIIPKSSAPFAIKELEVYESTNDVQTAAISSANSIAYADLEPLTRGQTYPRTMFEQATITGVIEKANFVRLDSMKYKYDMNLGTLNIRNLRQDRYYAVAYRIEGPTSSPDDDIYYGTLNSQTGLNDTLLLKMIYRPNMQPGYQTLWKRQMRNIYQINATNVNLDETTINVWYIRQSNDSTDLIEGAPDKLVTILGVDQVTNGSGAAPPDGLFDFREPFFNQQTGEITFPSTEPFRKGLIKYFSQDRIGNPELALIYTFPEVYDTTYDIARLNTARDRFVISGEVSGRATNRISLGVFNLSPGSVRVTLNGRELREYQDYVVDYYAGAVTLRNPQATLPNANLKIEYEQRDIFNISTRTLAGVRGDFQALKTRRANANIGFTLMHYDQSAVVDRVRLGEEPVSNTMFGLDGRFEWDTPWLTKALDFLPFYDTKAKSSINLGAEWALMLPNPNKRESTVASDNNAPVVYIDDFEGAQRYISLGLNASMWQHSSQPADPDKRYWESEQEAALYRGRMFWYQFFIPRIPRIYVYPNNRSYLQGNANISPLMIDFNPDYRGIYNQNAEFLDELNPNFNPANRFSSDFDNRRKIWGGMQRLLSAFNTNFDNENIEYIEIMMQINLFEADENKATKMYIDLGLISEDIIPDGSVSTEDGSTEQNPLPNNIIDVGEDTGLDTLTNEEEKTAYPFPLNLEDDPARDDYNFDFGKNDADRTEEDFIRYNNFQGNATQAELGQFPDTEILNANNGQNISTDNSYFTYEVVLDPNPNMNSQIVGGNPERGWFLYRLPVRKPSSFSGNPLFTNIQYIRVRFQGGAFKGQIAEWRLVGSQWQRISNFQTNQNPNDSVLTIAFVNLWENSGAPDFYEMPPGVSPPRVINNPNPAEDIQLNEQSISICVDNLRYDDERMATRIFRPMDLFFYEKLKFFIHGDGSMPDQIQTGSTPKAYAFLRFGIDSANYYEYRRPLIRGWQDVSINLSELTAIKQSRDTSRIYERYEQPLASDELATISIKGNPILTRVQFFGLGIYNPAERYPNDLTTCMWVDELRLTNPEASSDWAGLANVDIQLADLGSVNASFQSEQPNFHRLEERFGNRVQSVRWNFSASGNLEKFAPKSFSSMKLPITYSHSEFLETPQYVANNDVQLDEAASEAGRNAYLNAIQNGASEEEAQALASNAENDVRVRSEVVRVQDSWALTNVQLGVPIKHWLISETINKITMGYSYSQEFERSPLYEERFNWMWRLDLRYAINIPGVVAISPLGFLKENKTFGIYSNYKLNFLPSNFSANLNMRRRRQTEQSRFMNYPSPVFRDFSADRSASFSWKISEGGFLNPIWDYNFSTRSTMVPFELNELGLQRTGSELADVILLNEGKLIDLGFDNNHTQTVTLNFKPTIPNIGGIGRYIDMAASFNTIYNWLDPLQPNPAIRDQAKSASSNNNIRINMGLRLKSAADKWFGLTTILSPAEAARKANDTTSKTSLFKGIGLVFKTIFLDWEKIDFILNQQNSANTPGVYGGSGFNNFWARGMLGRESLNMFGPSWAYQMGLIEHPHGGFNIVGSDRFPFFGFDTYTGLRPADGIMQDNFRQQTTFEIRTARPLWKNATIDLNWKTELGYNRNQTVTTDENGVPTFSNINATESINRTFLTFPTIFGWNPFNNTIENVVAIFTARQEAILNSNADTVAKNIAIREALSESFFEGLKMIGGAGKAAKFLPSMNWAIRWEKIEEWAIWNNKIKRLTLEHSYASNYQENVTITDIGRNIQTQSVQYGFQPLIGLNANFDESLLNGVLTASLRWSTQTTFQINSAAGSTVSKQSTNEITATAEYTMKGFEFPLFGIMLKNDLSWIALFTFKDNARATYDLLDQASYTGDNADGRTLDGNVQIIAEPRIRYSVSNRLTASFFVRYEGTFTEGAAQPGFNTVQVGFDLRISIAGGR